MPDSQRRFDSQKTVPFFDSQIPGLIELSTWFYARNIIVIHRLSTYKSY
jgi:hypothetical protein